MLSQFDFDLPDACIAQEPVSPRDSARLLHLHGDRRDDCTVRDLPRLLRQDDLLVVNDTRVRAARLFGRRATGGRVECLFLRREPSGCFRALVRANKRLRPGEILAMDGDIAVTLVERPEADAVWRVRPDGDVDAALARAGHVPLPPYIRRDDRPEDRERYQTIFADKVGSAAAPTASLHFTPELADRLAIVTITLHVGYGTFQPVEAEHIEDHRLHREEYEVSESAARRIKERSGRLVAVGTTTTRVLESLARTGGIRAACGSTDL
ncbi:MAG: S-adenosylmethionine:tRNA ribosyltransferase-isomerase, partial [Planctomycetota bacterium]|nr:S-adenosylmethionine:tRNA ribosyltransferase-isomerase [Planctomycetota bacterium]